MFHSLVPHELLPQRMESLFIRDEVYMSECRFNTSTFLPATQIQGLRNVSKSLPFFPHCKSCLSYVIVSEISKEWKTLNTSNKTFMDSLSSCKGKVTHSIGAPCTSPVLLSMVWHLVFCTKGLYEDCWEGFGLLWCCQAFCDMFSGFLKHFLHVFHGGQYLQENDMDESMKLFTPQSLNWQIMIFSCTAGAVWT